MPCRCDGFEVTVDASHLKKLEEQVEHLEGQLCSARSVVHKLLRFIKGQPRPMPGTHGHAPEMADTVKRAEEHVAALLAHKRAEADADRQRALKRADELRRHLEYNALERHRVASTYHDRESRMFSELKQLEAEKFPVPTDEELLG